MLRAGRDVDDATPANARVIATAQQPLAPTFPKKAATVLLATLAGFLLAAGVVVARALPEAPGAETYAAPTMDPTLAVDLAAAMAPAPAMPTANAVPEAADEPPTEASMAPGDFDGNEDEREERVDPTTALEAIVDRLAESAETSDLLKVLVTGEATKGALAPGLTAARRLSKTGRAVLVDWASRSLGWATSSITEEPTRPLASPACSRAARASTRRCIAIFPRGSTFLPAGTSEIDPEQLKSVLAALAQSYVFVVTHASNWRSPAVAAAIGGVGAVIVCAPAAPRDRDRDRRRRPAWSSAPRPRRLDSSAATRALLRQESVDRDAGLIGAAGPQMRERSDQFEPLGLVAKFLLRRLGGNRAGRSNKHSSGWAARPATPTDFARRPK